MTRVDARFVIVGGGLAGLYAAHELEQLGISDHVLLEARPFLGGRISPCRPSALAPSRSWSEMIASTSVPPGSGQPSSQSWTN